MIDPRLSNLRGAGRRQFLRWTTAVAAALGLERSRFLDVLSDSAGVAYADTAACGRTMRSVHIVGSNGGFAHFQLIWPHVAVATGNNPQFAFHALGNAVKATTDKTFYYAPESPFRKRPKSQQVTALMAGINEAHTDSPASAATIATGSGMIAAIAAIQQASPSLLPVIGVQPLVYGNAPGAPPVATVANSAGLVGLFDSAASRTLLSTPSNAALAEAYYKAFLRLNRAAGRDGVARGYDVGKTSVNLLGLQLADKLRPTPADDARYGIETGTRTALVELARTLMIAVKAFELGLTNMVILPAFRDDPHGLFGGGDAAARASAAALGKILDAFMDHASEVADPSCTTRTLAENLVLTVHGDTPKNPFVREAWPDGTPNNANWMYVMGNGYLKTGWFGGALPGSTNGWDPVTGNEVAGQASSVTANAAAAAVAYAVAKGDKRRVQDFTAAPVDGVTVPQLI